MPLIMNVIIVFIFIVPVFVFGQRVSNVQINLTPTQEVALPEISNPYEIKKEVYNFRWNCGSPVSRFSSLVIVDGVFGELKDLNPSDIESISILKDNEAIAAFGTKGMNGVILITTKKMKTEYEVKVLDIGFEQFLTTQLPKDFYSEIILKNWNSRMVSEWNLRHSQPTQYSAAIYEVAISYNPQTDYGMDVEYTLYMFFRFMEKEHGISLI